MPRPSDKIIQQKKNRSMDNSKNRTADSVASLVLGAEKHNQKSLKDSIKTFDRTGKSV
jgi:hypothetical protein